MLSLIHFWDEVWIVLVFERAKLYERGELREWKDIRMELSLLW